VSLLGRRVMYTRASHDFLTITHLPALVAAEQVTTGDIIELGCGLGSTPMLNMLSRVKGRKVFSYESDAEWYAKFTHLQTKNHKIIKVDSFDEVPIAPCGMILIDHAPAERRQVEIASFKDIADVLVCHDSELEQYYSYDFAQFKYKYVYDVYPKTTHLVSNKIDIAWHFDGSPDRRPTCDCHGVADCPSYGQRGAYK